MSSWPSKTGVALAAAAVLLLCTPSLFPQEEFDCEESKEIGEFGAVSRHKAWPWFLAGLGSGTLGYAVPFLTVGPLAGVTYYTGTAGGVAGIVTAFIYPKRADVQPHLQSVDPDCYRDGYVQKARFRNVALFCTGYALPVVVVRLWARLMFRRTFRPGLIW